MEQLSSIFRVEVFLILSFILFSIWMWIAIRKAPSSYNVEIAPSYIFVNIVAAISLIALIANTILYFTMK